jgi:NCAIR mutase (PurE)-related protein
MIRIYEGYEIKPHREMPTSYIVVTAGKGGKIPNVLNGLYTTPAYAKEAIDKYLETKTKKED